jgi:TNF receptor-associated protein 1
VWESDGLGNYTITEAEGVERGTRVVIELNELGKDYSDKVIVQDVLEKHSNFVSFPIELNGAKLNTIQALWTRSPQEVTKEEHDNFYRFVAGAWDSPQFTLHYQTDAPVQLKALLYIPQMEAEKFGLGRQEPGVSLYVAAARAMNAVSTRGAWWGWLEA